MNGVYASAVRMMRQSNFCKKTSLPVFIIYVKIYINTYSNYSDK